MEEIWVVGDKQPFRATWIDADGYVTTGTADVVVYRVNKSTGAEEYLQADDTWAATPEDLPLTLTGNRWRRVFDVLVAMRDHMLYFEATHSDASLPPIKGKAFVTSATLDTIYGQGL